MKHRMLEYLATEMGFRIFSIEASMPASYKLNDYIINGKGDPNALIGGMHFWTWNTEEVLEMVQWMRRFNQTHMSADPAFKPLQFTGFDMQFLPDAAANVKEFVTANEPAFLAEVTKAYDLAAKVQSGGGAGGFGVGTGTFPVEAARGKKLVFKGWIRTENLKDGCHPPRR